MSGTLRGADESRRRTVLPCPTSQLALTYSNVRVTETCASLPCVGCVACVSMCALTYTRFVLVNIYHLTSQRTSTHFWNGVHTWVYVTLLRRPVSLLISDTHMDLRHLTSLWSDAISGLYSIAANTWHRHSQTCFVFHRHRLRLWNQGVHSFDFRDFPLSLQGNIGAVLKTHQDTCPNSALILITPLSWIQAVNFRKRCKIS